MYHELFVLLSYVDENNGLLQHHTLPHSITQMLEASGEQQPLEKALEQLLHHQLLKKTASQHYAITGRGRIALNDYKSYLEQQHQKGPHYYFEKVDAAASQYWKVRMLTFLVFLAALFGLRKRLA